MELDQTNAMEQAELVNGLTGLYTHIMHPRGFAWHGRIVGKEGNCVIVQMFNQTGRENAGLQLFPVEELTGTRALFYRDWETWRREGQQLDESFQQRLDQFIEQNQEIMNTPKNQKIRRKKS